MSFKLCYPGEVRYDIANYASSTDEQKNLIWLHEVNKPYEVIDKSSRVLMEHSSRLVKAYIEADEEEKTALWQVCDDMTKIYADFPKWQQLHTKKKHIREYLQKVYPDADENYYEFMIKKYI